MTAFFCVFKASVDDHNNWFGCYITGSLKFEWDEDQGWFKPEKKREKLMLKQK